MLIKPKVMPADPTKICRTCSHHDPDLHVCCANDYAIRDEEANIMSCSDWNPKEICITCGYFDPDTNQCWFEEHDMSEEESLTRTCESWEPRKVPKSALFGIPKEVEEALQYSEAEMQELRGRTLEALDMMTDIALQQMPGSKKRWLSLRTACIQALRNHWKHHDEAIKPYREEAKSHE